MRSVMRQGGSVAVFVVVGVVLVLAALGTVYGMKHIAMRDQTPPMTLPGILGGEENQSEQQAGNNGQENGTADEKPNQESGDQAPAAGNQDRQGSTGNNNAPSGNGQGNSGSSNGNNLPQSGPAETLASMVALSAIAASSTAYVRSRRQV